MSETKGEVVYEIRADDSNLESDLDAAQKKVEKSAEKGAEKTEQVEKDTSKAVKREKEEVTKHHKQQNEERVKDDEKSGQKREQNEKSVTEKIKGYISEAADQNPVIGAVKDVTSGLSGAQAAYVGAGVAAVAMGGMAVSGANDMKQAMNDYLASTGKSVEETERYQTVLENIYANNYGEDFADIASAMADVDKQLGELDDQSLQSVTESAFALRDVFDYDIPESTRAAKALMDNFGTDGEKAMALIGKGAQNGLDYSGELLDSISEYSVQFAKLGFDADDMFNIFQKGAESGAWNLDKIGDAVKEMSIRVIDGSDTTKEGFELLGLNADEMSKKFAAGGESAKEAFEQTVAALAELEDPLAQNTAGVDLFGTMWEDLGPEVVAQLASIGDEAYATAEDMASITDVKYDDLGAVIEELKRNLELLLIPLGELLIPLLSMLAESVLPLLTGVLSPLMEILVAILQPVLELISLALEPLISVVTSLIDIALTPLMGVLNLLLSVFQEVMQGIIDDVTTHIGNVTSIFQELMDFIKNVFTGNWSAAWENIKNIFSTIVSGLTGIFKSPINAIIDLINGFLKGLNKIKIPDWVPESFGGGKGFHIDLIPRLKKGMDFVPEDYFPAYLDYGERVLTQEENLAYTAMGGLKGMERVMSAGTQRSATGRVQPIVIITEIDGREAARAMTEYVSEQLPWEDL